MQDLPLLIVALMVLIGVFTLMWSLDSRARRLEAELRSELDAMDADMRS